MTTTLLELKSTEHKHYTFLDSSL